MDTVGQSAVAVGQFFQANPYFGVIVAIVAIIIIGFLSTDRKLNALDPEKYQAFTLVEIEAISHDVRRFRFALQSKRHTLGLPIGQHISFKYISKEGKEVIRSYTPTTSDDEKGYVDFVIKVYFSGVHPNFPNGGQMSQHLNSMKIGDTMLMKGPKGHLDYKGQGRFTINKRGNITKYTKKRIGMVAGGTGITPMLQIIRAMLKDPNDKTEVWLIFANQTEQDILLRKELESIPTDRFHLHYTVDKAPSGEWKYDTGFITKDMIAKHLPGASPDTMLWICGPPPMIKFAFEPHIKDLGFKDEDWFSF